MDCGQQDRFTHGSLCWGNYVANDFQVHTIQLYYYSVINKYNMDMSSSDIADKLIKYHS